MTAPRPAARPAARPAIGVLLPSSNRVVERVTRSILDTVPHIDACFTRVPYAGHPPDGYSMEPFLRAAAMLAEARPGILLWNATRGALLGFEPDRRLCRDIEAATGIPATTTALATVDVLKARGLVRVGLVAQGDDREGDRLRATFGGQGIQIVAADTLGVRDNFEAAQVPMEVLAARTAAVAGAAPVDAVVIWSTNLAGHAPAEAASVRLGIPVLDSATLGMRHALDRLAIL